jgi:hypothetical protein
MSARRMALVAITMGLALLAASCASSTNGTGTGSAGPSTASAPAATSSTPAQGLQFTPSSTPASSIPPVTSSTPTSAPTTGATEISSRPGIFVGTWTGHGRSLVVTSNGTASVTYRVYTWCSDDPKPPCDAVKGNTIIPGGRVHLKITKVVTAHHASTATATVTSSTDPTYPVGSTQLLPLKGDVIDSPFGSLCDPKGEAAGECGA